MPALHQRYHCHVCEKAHVLYLDHGIAPDLNQHFLSICPMNGFAVRITRADGWKPVDAKPQGALVVMGSELKNRVDS
jgi:hypothetical protein